MTDPNMAERLDMLEKKVAHLMKTDTLIFNQLDAMDIRIDALRKNVNTTPIVPGDFISALAVLVEGVGNIHRMVLEDCAHGDDN